MRGCSIKHTDILVRLRARLNKHRVLPPRPLLRLLRAHLPKLLRQIDLAAHKHARERPVLVVLLDLSVDDFHGVEGLGGGDGVDEDEAVDANGMFGIQDRVLVLDGEGARG